MWHTKSISDVAFKFNTDVERGLNKEEVQKRREENGLNKLEESKRESIIIRFLKQFNDFMIIILIIAAIISALISYIQKENDYIDSIIIISIVAFNALMGVIQEEKAEKSLDALKEMSAPMAKVIREGRHLTIPSVEVVVGDIVILEAGNYVPADARLISSYNLKAEESSLTGETESIEKNSRAILDEDIPIGDMINMVFSGSIITSGHGEAIVTEIGMNTRVGKIAKMLITGESPETPLQKRLRRGREKIRSISTGYMFCNFCNRNNKENRANRNVYDISWTSCSSNTRRVTSSSYNYAFNWRYKNGKKKCNNKKIASCRDIRL